MVKHRRRIYRGVNYATLWRMVHYGRNTARSIATHSASAGIASADEATTRKKNEMNSINVSPFATNVLDLIGKELVNSNGDSVLVKNCFNGFNVVVNGESKIICDDNLTVSRFLNSMEVSYK